MKNKKIVASITLVAVLGSVGVYYKQNSKAGELLPNPNGGWDKNYRSTYLEVSAGSTGELSEAMAQFVASDPKDRGMDEKKIALGVEVRSVTTGEGYGLGVYYAKVAQGFNEYGVEATAVPFVNIFGIQHLNTRFKCGIGYGEKDFKGKVITLDYDAGLVSGITGMSGKGGKQYKVTENPYYTSFGYEIGLEYYLNKNASFGASIGCKNYGIDLTVKNLDGSDPHIAYPASEDGGCGFYLGGKIDF